MHATKLLLCLLLSITAVHAAPSNSTPALNATADEPEPPADAIAPMRSVWMEKADSFVDSIVGQGMLLAGDAKEAANLRMEQGMALALDAKERLDVLVRDEIAPMLSVWMEKADSFVDSIVGQGMLLAGDAKEAANLRMEQGMALALDAKERLDVLVNDEPRLIGTVLTFVLVMIAIRLFLRRQITEGIKNAPSSNSVRSSVQAKENMQTSDDASDDASDDGSEATREGTPLQTRTDALFDMLSAVSTPDEMGELRRKREAIERTLTPKELFADQVEEDSGAGRAEKVPIEDEMDPLHRSIDDIVQSLTSLLAGE